MLPVPHIIKPLNAWRALAALIIYFTHNGYVEETSQLSWFSVTFFFVVSGFLLPMWHDAASVRHIGYRHFVLPRVLRLYVVHWIALAVYIAVVWWFDGRPVITSALLPNFLLVHTYMPVRDVFFSYNGVSWFMSCLVLAYMLYPILVKMPSRTLLAIVVTIGVFHLVATPLCSVTMKEWFYVNPVLRLSDFILGILTFRWLTTHKECAVSTSCAGMIEALTVLLIVLWLWAVKNVQVLSIYDQVLVWWLPVVAWVMLLVAFENKGTWLNKILCLKPLLWLGSISLAVFMFHGALTIFAELTLIPVLWKMGWQVYLPVVIVASWMITRYVIMPLFKTINNKLTL